MVRLRGRIDMDSDAFWSMTETRRILR